LWAPDIQREEVRQKKGSIIQPGGEGGINKGAIRNRGSGINCLDSKAEKKKEKGGACGGKRGGLTVNKTKRLGA